MKYTRMMAMILILLIGNGCSTNDQQKPEMNQAVEQYKEEERNISKEESMNIQVSDGVVVLHYELNDSPAAKSFYKQLPLQVKVENFSDNEKICYPDNRLDIADAPYTSGKAGTMAYYEPWGNVVMFYGSFEPSGSLYELGNIVEGSDEIAKLSGTITISSLD